MCNNLIESISQFIEKNNLLKPHTNVIVGLSGGPDSVFLLYVLKELSPKYNINIIAGHLDHQWREESYKDVIFCQELCNKLQIPFIAKKASEIKLKRKTKGSQEELGRLLRRQFLEELAIEQNCTTIALAHHQDDQQETFFIRLIRGASIKGLASIRPESGYYIRPLLEVYKAVILEFLHKNNITYLKDYTNELDTYLRNNIRNNVIPAFRKTDNRFDVCFKKTLNNLAQTDEFLDRYIDKTFACISVHENNKLALDKVKFLELDPFLFKPILLKWLCIEKVTFTPSDKFFDEILRFLSDSKSKKHNIYSSWSINLNKNYMFIEKT